MKHSGMAFKAAMRIIFWTLVLLLALCAAGVLATLLGSLLAAISAGLVTVWILFVLFTLYFFRDPDALAPAIPNAIVAPGHGKVDVIDETTEPEFMGGPCKRISIFLSVIDVHVQKAPVTGKLVYHKYKEGEFLSATRADCSEHNENVLLGIVPTDYPDQKIGLRLIAGLIARRIICTAKTGDTLGKGQRIGMIKFGSRTELYIPKDRVGSIAVKVGDTVYGAQTILGRLK